MEKIVGLAFLIATITFIPSVMVVSDYQTEYRETPIARSADMQMDSLRSQIELEREKILRGESEDSRVLRQYQGKLSTVRVHNDISRANYVRSNMASDYGLLGRVMAGIVHNL